MVYQMRQKRGRQAYFPGSISNKLFFLVTKTKMMKVAPTCDPSPNGRGRMNFGTKYALGLCGYALGLGVALELATDMKALLSSACSGNLGAAESAMMSAFLAIVAKFPELCMYYLLLCVYFAEFCYFFWSACCGCVCGRGLDNSDDKLEYNRNSASSVRAAERGDAKPDGEHCCQGVCDTREDPPKGRGCNQPWIETFFYRFYCWFFFAIDDVMGAFYMFEPKLVCLFFGPTLSSCMKKCPGCGWFPALKIPYWPNLDAFKKDYAQFSFQAKLDQGDGHVESEAMERD
jgi:hypothetical protein